MMNPETKLPVTPTTEVQEPQLPAAAATNDQDAAPDMFDKFAAWAKPRLNRMVDNVIDNPWPLLQFALANMDSRRTHRNVRRVIERTQEIEMQTANLHLKTTVPQRYPAQAPRQLNQAASSQRNLPQGEERKRS